MTGHCWQCKAPLGSDGLYLEPKIIPKIQRLQTENKLLQEKIKKLGGKS